MIIFIIIVIIWASLGLNGVAHCDDPGTNWWIMIFMLAAPILPVIAHYCGLI